jgi:magnesium transporter
MLIAILLFVVVIILNLIKGNELSEGLKLAFTIGLSINVALIVSTLSGAVIPLIIKLLKLDPAVASGPFITTINDIFSLLIYFTLATLLIL